jgi:hypothetical protein
MTDEYITEETLDRTCASRKARGEHEKFDDYCDSLQMCKWLVLLPESKRIKCGCPYEPPYAVMKNPPKFTFEKEYEIPFGENIGKYLGKNK